MLLLPAIDLRGGKCVRLLRGSFSDLTSYSLDPVETARRFCDLGARWIHVVDLDAAEGKGADNREVIRRIRKAVSCRMQVGGGVRSVQQAEKLLSVGVDRIILGTVVVKAPEVVRACVAAFGERFAAGVDARGGRVKVHGWTEDATVTDAEVASGLAELGIRWLVYTNIDRDGTLEGPDIARTVAAARASRLPTVLSGGIGADGDVQRVAQSGEPLLAGTILGKALYESRVDLAGLMKRYPQGDGSSWDQPASR
jgi:phosphoribosylformimino-5-aminoimidazole carboxamide ribotide isomerase